MLRYDPNLENSPLKMGVQGVHGSAGLPQSLLNVPLARPLRRGDQYFGLRHYIRAQRPEPQRFSILLHVSDCLIAGDWQCQWVLGQQGRLRPTAFKDPTSPRN